MILQLFCNIHVYMQQAQVWGNKKKWLLWPDWDFNTLKQLVLKTPGNNTWQTCDSNVGFNKYLDTFWNLSLSLSNVMGPGHYNWYYYKFWPFLFSTLILQNYMYAQKSVWIRFVDIGLNSDLKEICHQLRIPLFFLKKSHPLFFI